MDTPAYTQSQDLLPGWPTMFRSRRRRLASPSRSRSLSRVPRGITQPGASVLALRSRRYVPRGIKADLHYFQKTFQLAVFSVGAAAFEAFAYQFSLGQLTEAPIFAQLFDSYRITKCVLTIIPQFTEYNGATLVTPFIMYTSVDSNSAVPPVNATYLMENPTCQITQSVGKPAVRTVYPRVEMDVDAGISSVVPTGPVWLNTANPGILHNAFKIGFDNFVVPAQMTIKIFCRMFLEMKSSI